MIPLGKGTKEEINHINHRQNLTNKTVQRTTKHPIFEQHSEQQRRQQYVRPQKQNKTIMDNVFNISSTGCYIQMYIYNKMNQTKTRSDR